MKEIKVKAEIDEMERRLKQGKARKSKVLQED